MASGSTSSIKSTVSTKSRKAVELTPKKGYGPFLVQRDSSKRGRTPFSACAKPSAFRDYLYLLSTEALDSISFTDGEVEGFQQIPLADFMATNVSEMTDSTLILFDNVSGLEDLIREKCNRRAG